MVQQLRDELSRSVVRPATSTAAASLALPNPTAGRALKWNATASALVNSDGDPDAAFAAATAAQSAQSGAEAARDATLDAFDNFDDRYLGAKAVDPETDNTLVAGTLYFNATDGAMRLWTGVAWVAAYVAGGDYIEKDRAWPIGSIYVNAVSATNPAVLLGFGTWTALGAGRVLIGVGTGNDGTTGKTVTVGETGGEYAHTLSSDEMPAHGHTGTAASAGVHSHTIPFAASDGYATYTGTSGGSNSPSQTTSSAGAHTHTVTIDAAGGDAARNNVQPYLGVYMWVRAA